MYFYVELKDLFFIVFKSKLIIYRKDCCNKRYIIK